MSLADDQKIVRAHEASSLLQNEILRDAFAACEKRYMLKWRNSNAEDREQREFAYALITALDDIKHELTSHIHEGKILSREHEQRRTAQEIKRGLRGNRSDQSIVV